MIVVQPIGGLANRMRVLDSAIALSSELNETLWVLWTMNRELNCRFEELFEVPPAIGRLNQINTMAITGKVFYVAYRRLLSLLCNLQLTDTTIQALGDTGADLAGLAAGKRVAIFGCKRFYESARRFDGLSPAQPLQDVIDSVLEEPRRTVGVHVRRGDSEWPVRYSPTTEFIRLMEEELKADGDTTFFVASDSEEEEDRLRTAFPGRVTAYRKRSRRRDRPDGMQDGLVDLFCLSRCRKVIGSFGSSFAEVACQMSGTPLIRARVFPSPSAEFSGRLDMSGLADDATAFETFRRLRWSGGTFCPECGGDEVVRRGCDPSLPGLHTYFCRNCVRPFTDLTGTVFSRQPAAVRTWLLCLYYVGDDRSDAEIAQRLYRTRDEVAQMRGLLGGAPD